MRRITIVLALLFIQIQYLHSQTTNLEKAKAYIKSKGEVRFIFKANSEAQVKELASFLSIDHNLNRATLEIEAYANAKAFNKFITYKLPYTVNTKDNEFISSPNANTWDTNWNQYPSYSQYVSKMKYFAAQYPKLCRLETIGKTSTGRELLVVKISDNVSQNEAEPEFLYTSSIHGDELTGYPLMIRLIDYLLRNYGTDNEVTQIVNTTQIYINPLANPDGAYREVGNDIITNPKRGNANNIDLNRNYPDNIKGLHVNSINNNYEAETLAFMKFEASRNFVLSANFHGGTEVINYPADNSLTPHADHDYYERISSEYATQAQQCSYSFGDFSYMTNDYDAHTNPSPGVTQGVIWYQVYGGRQDYMNFYRRAKEVTIELSNDYWVPANQLPTYWLYNKQALLNYIKQANYGFQGRVTDAHGTPIVAKISIDDHDNSSSWIHSNKGLGDYYRLINQGTYTVTYQAPGYITQQQNITITNNKKTVKNIILQPLVASPDAESPTVSIDGSASLNAWGQGQINWYTNSNDQNPIHTGAVYNTTPLTKDTSYYVEAVITKSNIGETNSYSNGNFFNGGTRERGLIFDCSESVLLNSVTINAEQTGAIEVQLQNSAGQMLDSRVLTIEQAGVQEIDLDFIIPIGQNLKLVCVEMSKGFSLYRTTSNLAYPYTNGAVSIKKSSEGRKAYNFFYNWTFAPVKSSRKEVLVTVENSLAVNEQTLPNTESYQKPKTPPTNIK